MRERMQQFYIGIICILSGVAMLLLSSIPVLTTISGLAAIIIGAASLISTIFTYSTH